MAFLASLVCLREMGGGLSPSHKDGNSGSDTALGHTRSAPRLLTATSELCLCLLSPCPWPLETGFVGRQMGAYPIYRSSLRSYPKSMTWRLP